MRYGGGGTISCQSPPPARHIAEAGFLLPHGESMPSNAKVAAFVGNVRSGAVKIADIKGKAAAKNHPDNPDGKEKKIATRCDKCGSQCGAIWDAKSARWRYKQHIDAKDAGHGKCSLSGMGTLSSTGDF